MAKKLTGTIQPMDIDPRLINVTTELIGRNELPSDETIAEMAKSIQTMGQLQPSRVVAAGKAQPGRFNIVFGATRALAGQAIVDAKRSKALGLRHDPDFKLSVQIAEYATSDDMNLRQFRQTLTENLQRNNYNQMDLAHNYEILSKTHKMTDVAASKEIGVKPSYITQVLKPLLKLPERLQKLVLDERISAKLAVEVADLDDDAQDRVIEAAQAAIKRARDRAAEMWAKDLASADEKTRLAAEKKQEAQEKRDAAEAAKAKIKKEKEAAGHKTTKGAGGKTTSTGMSLKDLKSKVLNQVNIDVQHPAVKAFWQTLHSYCDEKVKWAAVLGAMDKVLHTPPPKGTGAPAPKAKPVEVAA